jgi:opacity protein-like surface antigen
MTIVNSILRIGLVLSLLLAVCMTDSHAQRRKKFNKRQSKFLEKQWWIGARGGVNLTKAIPIQRYSVYSSSAPSSELDKSYQNYKQTGAAAGMEVTFCFHGFSASFQPNFRRERFVYTNQYSWSDPANSSNTLQLNYEQDHHLDYFEFPFLLKYDILHGDWKPYVQAGYYYGRLNNATKSIVVRGIDGASGGNQFEQTPVIVGAKDLFIKSSAGFLFGAGVSYELGNIKLLFDVNYRYGTNNITNRANRYTNNQLAGSGDAMDDIKLRNISFNFGCLFPMRFLDVNYWRAN